MLPEGCRQARPRIFPAPERQVAEISSDDGPRALAHITGGGVPGNLPRVLPEGLGARVERSSWEPPTLFQVLAKAGEVEQQEMDRVFNMGVGMIAVSAPEHANGAVRALREAGEQAWILGDVEKGSGVRYA